MNPLQTVLIAVGLAMDALAVSLATSLALRGASLRQVFRLSFHFGLFQAVMPILGWIAGASIGRFIARWDHWVAFALLALIGGKAIRESFSERRWSPRPTDPTRGWLLIALSLATSIDALAVGVSLAMLGINVWYPAAVIGGVTCVLTAAGMLVGHRLGARFGRGFEFLGGLILLAIGVKILVEHLW